MKSRHFSPYSILLVTLVWLLSSTTLASNKTSNNTEGDGHTTTDELLEHFFEMYGGEKAGISSQQLCNLTKKLVGCNGDTRNVPHDDHAHEENNEDTKEHLVTTEEEDHENEHEEEEGEEEEEDVVRNY